MFIGIPVLAGLLVVSGVLSTLVAAFLWNERPKSGTTPLMFVEISLALWAFGQAIVLAGDGLATKTGGYAITLFAMATIGPSLFLFARQYTGHPSGASRELVAGLAVVPAVVLVLGATNVGDLAWVDPTLVQDAAVANLSLSYGPVFWGVVVYTYALLFVGDYLLFGKFVGSRNVYRKRTFFFLAYSVLLTGCHALSTAGLSPVPHYTLAPLANLVFGSLSLLVFVGFRSYEFLPLKPLLELFGSRSKSLAPVARTAMIEEMGGGMLVTDHRNRVVDINPMGRKILGDPEARVVGRQLEDVLPPDIFVDDADVDLLDPEAAGEFPAIWVRTPTGEKRCFDVTVTRLDGDDGAAGRVSLIHDVTERERRKQALEERTEELRRQNEQLDEFASIVSHDLRNPLNVAESAIELARHNEELSVLDRAEGAHDRMEDIIENVLTLARQGQTVDDTEAVELHAIAREAWANVDTEASDLQLVENETVRADRTRLLQVFENLFRNSIEHGTSEDGDDVTVTVGTLRDGFYVEDDGPGIPEDQQSEVLDQGFTTSENGTGFGLAIVETVADAHGWDVTVTDAPTGGARFEFSGIATDESTVQDEALT
ncbi:histidine kinase N-terminal 7TM domain-containing protein [Halorientalis halophila]|uniref:histidine kinase N-terminal 7TM domain-containing protein n=1 Tax=Halorientalis halophila TaxID=3108499 RepID=UPI003009ECF0